MPTLDWFIEFLMHEQDKLLKMGIIKGFDAHELYMHERSNKFNPKSKNKGKGKAHSEHKKEDNSKPFDDSNRSKGGKGKKGKSKCGYFNRDYHPESSCMKKTIYLIKKEL
jgi:hypothetical protein